MKVHQRIFSVFAAVVLAVCPALTAAAESPLSNIAEQSRTQVAEGVELTVSTATAGDRPQTVYAVTASGEDFAFEIGGTAKGKSLITEAEPRTLTHGEEVVAAVNGDHFSFATGVPLGMAISDGRIIGSPVEAYNADEYFFHTLGIMEDGTVLTGENPELIMQCTVGRETITIDRINRTRETWTGAQICLFTPDYGTSTGTDNVGVEVIVRVEEGEVAGGSTLKGTVEEINYSNDSPLEEGTVVLSINLLRDETEYFAVGDSVEFLFDFTDKRWNDVEFAVGGNLTIVENGEPLPFDYELGVFTAAAPRSALGVRADGMLVMAAVDGRSDISKGLTANEMAEYMAHDMDCAYAILLDGGGSTAMATVGESGALELVNVPSEERPVGNTVLLVRQVKAADVPVADNAAVTAPASFDSDMTLWIIVGVIVCVAVVGGVVLLAVLYRPKHGKNN